MESQGLYCEIFKILLVIFKLRQTRKVFETSTSHTKAQTLGEATHHNLITVERVGTDVFALGDTVKALARGYM